MQISLEMVNLKTRKTLESLRSLKRPKQKGTRRSTKMVLAKCRSC